MTQDLEEMGAFFDRRVDKYEEHMIQNVDGHADCCRAVASFFPTTAFSLLDLGCGSGMELDEIFKRCPTVKVTGIDLSRKMLDKLAQKHSDKAMTLINKSYLEYSFGAGVFDAAVSVQTMHHLTPLQKRDVYRRIRDALTPDGFYVEADYTAKTKTQENDLRDRLRELTAERPNGTEQIHFDIPCAKETQLNLLKKAGFRQVRAVGFFGNAVVYVARKSVGLF